MEAISYVQMVFKNYIKAQREKVNYDALGKKKLTKEEEFIYYGSNEPRNVKMEELDYEELDELIMKNMKEIGLEGDQAKEWIRSYAK